MSLPKLRLCETLTHIMWCYFFTKMQHMCDCRFDASDITLLLAIAGTHSPDLLLSLTDSQLHRCQPAV